MKRLLLLIVFIVTALPSLSYSAAAVKDRPVSVTLQATFPHLANVGLDYRPSGFFSFGVSGGYVPFRYSDSQNGSFDFLMKNVEFRLRLHPFKGGFFLGVASGVQWLKGQSTRDVSIENGLLVIPVSGTADLKTLYVTPHLGWFWRGDSGFTFGVELGWQFSFSPNTDISIPVADAYASEIKQAAEYNKLLADVEDVGNRAGKISLPFLTLVRIGYSF